MASRSSLFCLTRYFRQLAGAPDQPRHRQCLTSNKTITSAISCDKSIAKLKFGGAM